MISIKELCPYGVLTIPQEHEWNLMRLYWAVNVIRRAYAKPMFVTSGYRTEEDHEEIYQKKNEDLMRRGLKPVPVPMGSMHLCGAAVDIADADGSLKAWVLKNVAMLERLDLYCEAFDATATWAHFQIYAPDSGSRFFEP